MSESSHSVVISVDSSRARQGLADLQRQAQSTAQSFRSLGSSSGGFDTLAKQVAQTSGAFSALAKSLASVSAASRSIAVASSASFGGLSKAARGATSALGDLSKAFSVSKQAAEVLSVVVGGISLANLAKSTQNVGNNLMSFRIAIDAVATSSRESADALKFIRDTANSIGSPLDAATESFKSLYSSMRAEGRDPDEIFKVFRGFSTAMSALHVSAADQKMAWKEIAETYSMGVIHTRQAILSLGSHIPAMASNLATALGVTGEKLHHMFREGGLPLDTWTKVASLLEKRYGNGLAEAANHSTLNIIALQNAITRLEQTAYDGGFDSGLTALLKSLQNGLDTIGVDKLGNALGEAFRGAFTALAFLTDKVIAARGPIIEVGQALATYMLATTGIRILAGAFGLLLSPLGALAALTSLASSEWLNLSGIFSGSDAAFNAGAEKIRRVTNGFIDLHKTMKGAIELWELSKGLFDGKSFADSKALAAQAGASFDAGTYGTQKGQEFSNGFVERAKTLFGKLGETLKISLPSLDAKALKDEWDKLYASTAPTSFHGGFGDYAGNAARYGKPSLDLSEDLKKTYEKLLPVNKAMEAYRETLAEIARMKGKLDPLSGKPIGDVEIQRLKDAARETALHDAFPAASKISELMDKVRMEREALANVGGNTSKEALSQEKEFLTIKYDLLKKHVQLRADEEQALRGLIAAEHELAKGSDKDPFTRWANSQKNAQDALNDSIASGMDSLADGLANAVTSGKDLRSTLQGVLKEISSTFIKAGIRSLMSDGLKTMHIGGLIGNLTGGKDSISTALAAGQNVLDRANGSLDKLAEESLGKSITTPLAEVTAQIVNVNGATISGLNSFKPASDISNAIKPESLGGISPSNDNGGARLFANNVLKEFKGDVKTGGLGSIPSNSASLFGAGLSGRKGLGDIGGALQAIPNFKLGSGESVKAFGEHLEKLAPVASRAGLSPVSDSLAAMYAKSGLSSSTIANMQGVHPDLQKVILRAKELSGAQFTVNHGQGLRSQAEANANAAKGLGIRNSQHIEGTALDVNLYRNGKYVSNGGDPIYRSFNDSVQRASKEYGLPIKWGGDFNDPDHFQLPRGWKGARKQSAGLGDLGKPLGDESRRATEEIKKQIASTRQLTTEAQKNFTGLAQTSGQLTNFDSGIGELTGSLQQGIPAADGFGSQLQKLIEQLLSGIGGGGGGLGGGLGDIIGGLFSEGGSVDNPTQTGAFPASLWHGAPRYANGGAIGDGIPIIAHPGEIILNRAQQSNVAAAIGGGDDNRTTSNVVNVNIASRDADSFRRSKGQIGEAMARELGRMRARNG